LEEGREEEVSEIKKLTGVDVSGFTHNGKANAFQHISKRHGTFGLQDMSMADLNDIGRLPYILKNYDSVDFVRDERGAVKYANKVYNADGSPAPLIKYDKRIDGHYYVVEAVSNRKSRRLEIVSAYIEKANQKEPNQLLDANAPRMTPKSGDGIEAPLDKNVHQTG